MRRIAFLVAAALTFGLAPFSARLGPVLGAALLVALTGLLAIAASGVVTSLGVAGGAVGAFAGGMLAASPAAAGAVLAGLCFAERSTRVRGQSARLLHVGAAVACGALAASITTAFEAAPLPVRAVAVIVGAVLLALPLLIDADDPLAHALDLASLSISGPVSASLKNGAELRRTIDEDLLDRTTARQVRKTWASLLRLAEARVRLERASAVRAQRDGSGGGSAARSPADAVIVKLDSRIADHVIVLTRAYTAVDAAKAAEVSLDDTALRGVETMGESYEHVSRAIVEDV